MCAEHTLLNQALLGDHARQQCHAVVYVWNALIPPLRWLLMLSPSVLHHCLTLQAYPDLSRSCGNAEREWCGNGRLWRPEVSWAMVATFTPAVCGQQGIQYYKCVRWQFCKCLPFSDFPLFVFTKIVRVSFSVFCTSSLLVRHSTLAARDHALLLIEMVAKRLRKSSFILCSSGLWIFAQWNLWSGWLMNW